MMRQRATRTIIRASGAIHFRINRPKNDRTRNVHNASKRPLTTGRRPDTTAICGYRSLMGYLNSWK